MAPEPGPLRGMMGAGIVSLSMAGEHDTGWRARWATGSLAHPCVSCPRSGRAIRRIFAAPYYCSQAAAQLGGRYWEGLFPGLVDVLVKAQSPDGSWPPEPNDRDYVFGSEFTTAFAILSLTPPYQLLPVYQR